jgi:hypothetical protein
MRPIALLATLLIASSAYLDAACHKPPKPRIDWLGTLTGCSPNSGTCAALEPINFFAKTADGSAYAACIDASSGQPFPILDARAIGTVAFTPMKTTIYTLTALGDAAHSPPSLITVEVLAAAKRRSVKH